MLDEHGGERLLGDAQNGQQFRHRDARVAADEVDDAVVSPAEAVGGENLVGLAGEVAVGEEQQLHRLAQLFLAQDEGVRTAFYVSPVDISTYSCSIWRVIFDRNYQI